MELIGPSMGIHAEDIYKRLEIIGDVDAIIAETRGHISVHGLNDEMVRKALLIEYKNVQRLPDLKLS